MFSPLREEIASLRTQTGWVSVAVVLVFLVAATAAVLAGFGFAGYLREEARPACTCDTPAKSWFIRPALLDESTSFFALSPSDPNPSYIPFQTQTGPSIGTSFSVGGNAFDTSHVNYTTVLLTGVYEFTLHVTLIALPPTLPTVGVVMMNSTEPAFTVPILLGSIGTLSNVSQLPYAVRAATGSATILLDAGTSIYVPYITDLDAFVTPGTYWSGALLFET